MAKNSGGTRGNKKATSKFKVLEYTKTAVNDVKSALIAYAKIDHWNNSSAYDMGYNDDALAVVERVADANLGLATTIAKQAISSKQYKTSGVTLSEKQAYVIADAAVKNGLVPNKTIFQHYDAKSNKTTKTTGSLTKQQLSTTKAKVGSVVTSKHGSGVISKIITKSSGYVEVKYDSGITRKEMTFNLKGQDGNPLRNKPR